MNNGGAAVNRWDVPRNWMAWLLAGFGVVHGYRRAAGQGCGEWEGKRRGRHSAPNKPTVYLKCRPLFEIVWQLVACVDKFPGHILGF